MGAWQERWLTFWKRWRARAEGTVKVQAEREIAQLLREQLRSERLRQERGERLDPPPLSEEDERLVRQIRRETDVRNRNNITRTQAYWEVYDRSRELHWALLAHMVSRNGGYQMTDLKGDLIARAMEAGEHERFFQFLERANRSIFGDAYPQLLLYEASRKQGRPLFHLLPCFAVSRFMRIIWERYWARGDEELLTIALVINEQNMVEQHVVQQERFKPVIESFEFQAQTYLNLTQVIFPYLTEENRTELAGCVVDTFLSLTERIDTGRRLYAILFGIPEVHAGVVRFAKRTPHTASRADYFRHLYTAERSQPCLLSERYDPRVEGDALRPGAKPIYSPSLWASWPDVPDRTGGSEADWCRSTAAAVQLFAARPSEAYNISELYMDNLKLVERAVAAESWIKADE